MSKMHKQKSRNKKNAEGSAGVSAFFVRKRVPPLKYSANLKMLESGIDPATSRFEVESRESLYRTVF